jgi:anti-sigma factor RsiW
MELTCREVVEHITDLLGDALAMADRARLEQHLLICPPCTLHVAQVRDTIALAGEARRDAARDGSTAPAGVDPAALAAFRAWKARRP